MYKSQCCKVYKNMWPYAKGSPKTLNWFFASERLWNRLLWFQLAFSWISTQSFKESAHWLHRNVERAAWYNAKCTVRYTWVPGSNSSISYELRGLNLQETWSTSSVLIERITWNNYVKVLAYNRCLVIVQFWHGEGISPTTSLQAFPRPASYPLCWNWMFTWVLWEPV